MTKSTASFASALLLAGLLPACGSTTQSTPPDNDAATGGDDAQVDSGAPDAPPVDAGPDVDNGMPSTNYPAPHPPLPQLVNQAGGKTLATPKVYLIFYPGYPHEMPLQTLAQQIGANPYWAAATAEYGVGAMQYAGMIELTGETPPISISDQQIDMYMNGKIASGAFGTPDTSVVYTIYYPKTTTITLGSGGFGGGTSCQSFGGYHTDTAVTVGTAAPKNYAYAVLPTCASFAGMGELDGLTGATSHEWIEASTDPFPSTNGGADSAYSGVDSDHFIWAVLGGQEDGDLCVQETNAFFKPSGLDFTVQRCWSNQLAKASHDPCAPDLTGVPFFDSAPVLNENVSFTSQFIGGTVNTKGVKIPVGQTKTVEVDLFSDAATSGPWSVEVLDVIARYTMAAPTLAFKWDRTSGLNGEKLHLDITVKATQTAFGGAHPFIIVSRLGGVTNTWPGLVVEQ
ncbi:MAG TPA: hypothetical protein VNY84_11790 [Acidimicrobiales bacterium]|nr:hypothetical protein [Acidimicrobiales bacterium]